MIHQRPLEPCFIIQIGFFGDCHIDVLKGIRDDSILSARAHQAQRILPMAPGCSRRHGVILLGGLRRADYDEVERDADYLNLLLARSVRRST